ncbi:MAG: PA14 domain-containing protein, partial [Sedimentisphaerales bacterium]
MSKKLTFLVSFTLVLGLAAATAVAELVAYYPLDEGSGTIAADASGNGYDGEIQGTPNWVNSKSGFGKALYFDGQNPATGWVNCGTWDTSENTGQLTIALWLRWDGAVADVWQGIMGKRDEWAEGQVVWYLEVNMESQQVGIGRYGVYPDCGGRILPEGEWAHVAAAFDGTTMVFYINGEETGRGNFSLGEKTDATIEIGCDNQSGWNSFHGAIDEVRIYNNALTPEQIQTVMIGQMPIAYKPKPADGAIHPDTWASLSWTPGTTAASHDVYFGDNFDDVNTGAESTFQGNQAATFYVVGFPGFPFPDGLSHGTTYYWRIDEIEADGTTIHKGDLWSFTVPPKTAYNPRPADGAKFIDPNVALSWDAGFGTKLHRVYFGDNFDDVNAGTPNTSKGLVGDTAYVPGTLDLEKTYYWRIDEFDGINTYKGNVWSFTTMKAGGGVRADYYKGTNFETLVLTRTDPQINFNWGDGAPDEAVGADSFSVRWTGQVEAAFTDTYTFYARSDDGVRLWVEGQQLVDSWVNRSPAEDKGTIDLIAGQLYSVVMEYYDDSGGAVAELRWSSPHTPKQLIPQAALSLPVKASSANPPSGATDVKQTTILTWAAGDYAASHEVYFGTDQEAVRNADTSSPEYKGTRNLGSESYDPGKLLWNATYYWRIDEVNNVNPDSPWVGGLWSFTTANFLVVDDFEDYDVGNNEIWWAWKDGIGYASHPTLPAYPGNGTGSMVGDETTGSYCEETIVHGGSKSMPLFYDNSVLKYSEAQKTLTSPRDWTENGVSTLSIWFRGDSANAAETLYVALNGSAVVYHDNPNAALIDTWTQWNIDLQAFADQGVNLANVNTIAIGLGDKKNPQPGGSGTM